VLAISVGTLIFLAQLISQPSDSMLQGVVAGLPGWLPDAAFIGLCAGLLMAIYRWTIRHVGQLIRRQL
jgi:hypothetical protein